MPMVAALRSGRPRLGSIRVLLVACILLPACPPSRLVAQKVLRLSDLTFTRVIAGVPLTIRPSDATAAKFRITPDKGNATLQVVFSLPASLAGSSPRATPLPISFSASSAIWSENPSISGGTAFDPAAGLSVPVQNRSAIYVWIGGTVQPPSTQAGGDYTGTITVTATGG